MIPCPNLFQTLNTGNQSSQGTPTTQNATPNKVKTSCSNCGQKGHYANRCPRRRKSSTPTPGTPAPPNCNGSSTATQAQQNYVQGRLNQVLMEEADNARTMESGTSLVKFYFVLTVICFLFFSIPKNLWMRFLLRGVVLSHSKISNFGM
jgi:hypothetical protein